MKKTDWIILFSLTAYAVLFWKQMPGFNFLLMNCILTGGLLLRYRSLFRNVAWLVAAGASLLTAFCVFRYGSALSVIANIISLLLTSSFVVNSRNSWFGALALGMLNTLASCAFIFVDFVYRMNSIGGNPDRPRKTFKRVVLLLCIIVIVSLFFGLYRGSSVLFEAFTNKIDLSFISIGWCVFMAGGGLLLFSFFKQQNFDPFTAWDRKHEQQLQPKERNGKLDAMMSLDSEYFSGIVLFALLNGMLLLVNTLDIVYLLGGAQFLPEDVTYSEYVHQGINQLIVSILFATALILFWFRNYHTGSKQFRSLKWLALLWVLQNVVMVAMTIHRNHSYISVFGLTYKRIGVDVYLLLAMTGLLLVMWKMIRQRSNAFVLHRFGWASFVMLVLATPVAWDKLIFYHNTGMGRAVDADYINSLSEEILPLEHRYTAQGMPLENINDELLQRKTYAFLCNQRYQREQNRWPSMTLAANAAYDELNTMPRLGKKQLIVADNEQLPAIYFFAGYSRIQSLVVYSNGLDSIGEAGQYTFLEFLDLRFNTEIRSIEGIQNCRLLRELDLRGTSVIDFSPLKEMPNLETLYVNHMEMSTFDEFKVTNPNLTIKTF